MGKQRKVIVVTDGASRGNPGPAAMAFGIYDENGNLLHEEAEYIGNATNNEAEYLALARALDKCREYWGWAVEHYTDSQLVVNQLEGKWAVKARNLKPLIKQISNMKRSFKSMTHKQLPRRNPMIRQIDMLVNEKLNQATRSRKRPTA